MDHHEPTPPAAPQPWTPPPRWRIQILQADGSVIAEATRKPHHPVHISGDAGQLANSIEEIHSFCRFLRPVPPHIHLN